MWSGIRLLLSGKSAFSADFAVEPTGSGPLLTRIQPFAGSHPIFELVPTVRGMEPSCGGLAAFSVLRKVSARTGRDPRA